MAAIDFPNSPTTGQTFTVGSKTWTYDGAAWGSSVQRTPVRIASDTAPASPIANDEWFESSTGKSYIYYDSYWVEVNSSAQGQPGVFTVSDTAPSSPVTGTTWFNSDNGKQYVYNGTVWIEPNSNLAGLTGPQGIQGFNGNKNFILNGGFDINQRGTVSTSTIGYGLDRWFTIASGSASATSISQQSTGAAPGTRNHMRITMGASGGYGNQYHFMDTSTVSQLWGKTVTLSAKVRRSASATALGTLSIGVQKTVTVDGGPSATFVNVPMTGITFVENSVIPTGTTSLDWYTLYATFSVPNDGTANGLVVSVGQQNLGAAGTHWELSSVQLELGSTVTDFARNSETIAGELAACQRFYERVSAPSSGANNPIGTGMVNNSTSALLFFNMKVPKRIFSSTIEWSSLRVVGWNTGGSINLTTPSAITTSPGGTDTMPLLVTATGMTAGLPVWLDTSGTTGFLAVSAELT